MNKHHQGVFMSIESSCQSTPMFSLNEQDSYYVVSIDLPTLPSNHTQIRATSELLAIEAPPQDSLDTKTYFRMLKKGEGIKTVYQDGVLWLLLPKYKTISAPAYEAMAAG
jgi:hypothetical protein